jgi:superoxide dismutase
MKKHLLPVVTLFATFVAIAQTFTLPTLPYAYNALEPSIDAQTMEIHHSRHHQAYIKNLNAAVGNETVTLEDLLLNISKRNDAIRNNAGGHYNHTLFWEILAPASNKMPSAELQAAIESEFKSLDSLKKLLNQAASTRFGSGWAWLIVTPDKKLKVCSSPNQDNPIMDISKDRGIPILGIDVWEHAYYLKYQNKRGDYLNAIWSVVNWDAVSAKYQSALSSPLLKKIAKDTWAELNQFASSLEEVTLNTVNGQVSVAKSKLGDLSAKSKILASKTPGIFKKEVLTQKLTELNQKSQELQQQAEKKISDADLNQKLKDLKNRLDGVVKELEN